MNEREIVLQLFGEDVLKYLENKHRGGVNNQKGGKFECLFLAVHIATLAVKLIANRIDSYVESQSLSFVDDVVLSSEDSVAYVGHQLKNKINVDWASGKNPICKDFALQNKLCIALGYRDIKLLLVVADNELADELKKTVPSEISNYSDAVFFPYCEKPLQLLPEHASILREFGSLARTEEFTDTDCANIATLLVGVGMSLEGKVKLSDILLQAQACSPQIIRPICTEEEAIATLQPSFKEILDNIAGFNYSVRRGFLSWNYLIGQSTTSGVLIYNCFDPRFKKLQSLIEKEHPKNFDDLEGLLI